MLQIRTNVGASVNGSRKAVVGSELEYFVFNEVRYDQSTNYGYYEIDSMEANCNAAKANGPSLGHKLRPKEGYFPVPPADATLTRMADNVMIYKYVVKNVARKRGMTATFMPKPLFGDNGSGMHVHQSIWKGERPTFAGDGYAGSSELMRHYIGGLLKHAPALLALCAPTVNSYRRLVPGFEAPVPRAIARLPVVSPCTRPTPRRNASSSAAQTRPAIPTWRSRRCLWRALMGFRTASILAKR